MAKELKDVLIELKELLKQCMEDLGKQYREELYNYVKRTWYSQPYYEYQRTNETLESVSFELEEEDGEFVVKIYMDTRKILPHYTGERFQPHVSRSNGDSSDLMPKIFDSIGVYTKTTEREPIYWVAYIETYCEQHFIDDLKHWFQIRGIKII